MSEGGWAHSVEAIATAYAALGPELNLSVSVAAKRISGRE